MTEPPPIDLFDYWATDWHTGAASDGLVEYFEKWFSFHDSQGEAEFDSFAMGEGEARVVVWRRLDFLGNHEYVLLNRDFERSGARLRYMAVTDEESGEETLYSFLEGMTDLEVAWRRDLIEVFRGEPAYEEIKSVVTRYWRNEYAPRLLMQIDPGKMDFFFVPREEEEEEGAAGAETTTT